MQLHRTTRTSTFHAVPAHRCNCPGKASGTLQEALDFARWAADRFAVGYAVWRAERGRIHLLKRFSARGVRVGA